MKQLFLILCMVFTVQLYVTGQEFTISGEVMGAAEGQTVVLRQIRDMQQQPVDVATATVKDGKFTLKGNAPYPEYSMLYVGENGPLPFFVENSNINILIDMENFDQSKVTGSKENDIFIEFMGGFERFALQQQQLNDTFISLSTSGEMTQEILNGLQAQAQKLDNDRPVYIVNFALTNSGKVSSAFIWYNFKQMFNISQMDHIASRFDANNEQSQWVKTLKEEIAAIRRTEIGKKFTDVTSKTPDDKPISLSDYAGKGKYVLIDFWAGWCTPCRNANPRLVRLYNQYKDKGFEIVGISFDRDKETWVKAIRDDNLTWPQMSDLDYFGKASKLYSVTGIPHMVLLDKEGNIIAKEGLHVGTLTVKLAELFD